MDLSTRLSYLFGTEDYVGMRRQLVIIRERLLSYRSHERGQHVICSGSLGEGVAYPPSDDDLMISRMECRVVQTYREATQIGDALMVPSEFSPGYCRLLDLKGSYPYEYIQITHEMPFISSSLWKERYVEVAEAAGEHIHGPCQSGRMGDQEFDLAFCIHCFLWPDIASDWVNRGRPHEWPSSELTQNIIQKGCHVVPVGDPDSPYCQHEWRISFSVAERTLMHSFNHAQFLVYNLLRLTLKRIIDKTIPGVICSYFMKTTLFYTAENTSIDIWRVDNLETCFKTCVSVLYNYVDLIYCPNYFIPEYNMIKRKVNHTNRHQTLDLLRTVHMIGIVGIIHLSGESSCLHANLSAETVETRLDREFVFSATFVSVLKETTAFFYNLPNDQIRYCTFYLCKLLCLLKCNTNVIHSELIDIIWNYGINSCSAKITNDIFTSSENNKQHYYLSRFLSALLRIGFKGDVTTGKLTMAAYMYLMGKTDHALHVVHQLLSEYPPYAIDVFPDELKTQAYKDSMCGKGFTISYKIRHAHVPRYDLHSKRLNAFPSPLKMWIAIMDGWELDPLIYAYFLQGLCHALHQNQRMFMKSLRCLVYHMDDMILDDDIVDTRMCVGIIKCVQGNNQSACRWLGSAYVMKNVFLPPINERLSCAALTYIACLLNKKFQLMT